MSHVNFTMEIEMIFFSTYGVKQGDVISPLRFNFFIDELVKKLNISNCDPVTCMIKYFSKLPSIC